MGLFDNLLGNASEVDVLTPHEKLEKAFKKGSNILEIQKVLATYVLK